MESTSNSRRLVLCHSPFFHPEVLPLLHSPPSSFLIFLSLAGVDVVLSDSTPLLILLLRLPLGGIREAVKLLQNARREGLLVWIGIMVSSTLGSNIPAQLLPAADLGGDCDGHLWTTPDSDKFDGYSLFLFSSPFDFIFVFLFTEISFLLPHLFIYPSCCSSSSSSSSISSGFKMDPKTGLVTFPSEPGYGVHLKK